LRIVAGAGEKPAAGKGELARRRFDEGYHLARKGNRLEAREATRFDCDVLPLSQALEEVSEVLGGLLQQARIGIAQIDRQDRPFRDHVHEIGVKLDATDRSLLLAAHLLRETAHEHRNLARGVGCIAPQIHWRGAGVGGATGD
jgi:hypothetical protein